MNAEPSRPEDHPTHVIRDGVVVIPKSAICDGRDLDDSVHQ